MECRKIGTGTYWGLKQDRTNKMTSTGSRFLYSKEDSDKILYSFSSIDGEQDGWKKVGSLDNKKTSGTVFSFFLNGHIANPNGNLSMPTTAIKKAVKNNQELRFLTLTACGTFEVPKLSSVEEITSHPDIISSFTQKKPCNRKQKSAKSPSPSSSPQSSSSSSSADSSPEQQEEAPTVAIKPSSSSKVQKFDFPEGKSMSVEAEQLDEDVMRSLDIDEDIIGGLGSLISDIHKGKKSHKTNTVILTLFKTLCTINSLADETDIDPAVFYHVLNAFSQE